MGTVYKTRGSVKDEVGFVLFSSPGAGKDAERIRKSLSEIRTRQLFDRPIYKLVEGELESGAEKSISERLYDALARSKLLTAQVAMHLDPDWRNRIFEQLDDLLSYEDWHEEDEPVKAPSFQTFLRMILYHGPQRRPGFGVSDRGNLIAAWTSGSDRLTMEFLPHDVVTWVLSCRVADEIERAAGETPVRRMMEVLAPYSPDRWFVDASHQHT